jgi:hypothetical protein
LAIGEIFADFAVGANDWGKRYIPSYYGKKLSTGLGSRKSIVFAYEQPELITVEKEIVPG